MDNTRHSSQNVNGNGRNSHSYFFPRIADRILRRTTKPKTVVDAGPARDWRATPNTGYRPDGTYNHSKPTHGESQVGIAGKIPAVAFGMPDADYDDLARAARVTALCGLPVENVQNDARRRFEARWAQCKAQFAARIASGQRVVERLISRATELQRQIDSLPLLVPDNTKTLTWPRDLRVFHLLLLVALFLGCLGADWYLLASKQVEALGSWKTALVCTASWLAAPFLLKWTLLSRAGRVAEWLLAAFKSTSVLVLLLFVLLYAKFGISSESAADQAATLSAMMNGAAPAAEKSTDLGWVVFALQIGLCLVTSTALTVQIRELLVGRTVSVPNPDRVPLERELSDLHERVGQEESAIAPHTGMLVEYDGSLARFVGHGERAWHAAQADHEYLEQQKAILERERALLEEKRRLLDG